MRLRIILHSVACLFATTVANDAITRIADRYNLHNASDYRATVNRYDLLEGRDAGMHNMRRSDAYECAALLAGYKPTMSPISLHGFASMISNDRDFAELCTDNNLYCAHAPSHHGIRIPLVYRSDSRHTALCFLKYMILQSTDDSSCMPCHDGWHVHCYMMGTLFGYPEEDIRFFFQRIAFLHAYGYMPEDSDQACRDFTSFLYNEWPQEEAARVEHARSQVISWLNQQGSQEDIVAEIDALVREHPELYVEYDKPLDDYIHEYKRHTACYATIYLIFASILSSFI